MEQASGFCTCSPHCQGTVPPALPSTAGLPRVLATPPALYLLTSGTLCPHSHLLCHPVISPLHLAVPPHSSAGTQPSAWPPAICLSTCHSFLCHRPSSCVTLKRPASPAHLTPTCVYSKRHLFTWPLATPFPSTCYLPVCPPAAVHASLALETCCPHHVSTVSARWFNSPPMHSPTAPHSRFPSTICPPLW